LRIDTRLSHGYGTLPAGDTKNNLEEIPVARRPSLARCLGFGLSFVALPVVAGNHGLGVDRLGTYVSGLADIGAELTAAETAVVRRDRLYVTNASDVSVDVVDVSVPSNPRRLRRVDLSDFGQQINSVDVSNAGLVAVAVDNGRTAPGKVVFLSAAGDVRGSAIVGVVPDMVTFTPDGRKLLVANEGEPSCYNAPDCVDAEGTVSIVTVSPWRRSPTVRTVRFDGVPLPTDVRIFGPNATVAQDLEPEYIAVTEDGRTAYVTLQENNAVAVIDIPSASVVEIRSLGYKNFDIAPDTETFTLDDMPSIGTTPAGQELTLGGFSGLFYEGTTKDGKLRFIANTDRGPNGEPTGVNRPFLLPDFVPRLVRLEVDRRSGHVEITEQIELRTADGSPLTGLPNTAIVDGNGNTPFNDEVPVDLYANVLPLDALGGDLEGVVVAGDGTFWLPDEYRPALYHFDADGILLQRYVPYGTHEAAGVTVPGAGQSGVFGIEALPRVLGQRRQNRGFEAIALQNEKLYAFVQSPIRNPATLGNATLNGLLNIRLVEFDPATLETRQFVYVMDNPAPVVADDTRADKIGDAVALPGRGFLVVERDDDKTPDPYVTKRIYAFDLTGATDISSKDVLYTVDGVSKSLDQMTAAELTSVGVTPVLKTLHVDLAKTAYNAVEKVEGLAYVDANTLAVVNDNDFGVAVISIDTKTGTFTLGYTPEKTQLGLLSTHGFDASDRDNVVNIRDWKVYGMYQPDAIATFKSKGRRFLITANEGDAREYDGFAEEASGRDLRSLYASIPQLANNNELGRLTLTTEPPMGDYSQPYVFGTRSVTIWDARSGEPVWDSGNTLEAVTAEALPLFFNSNNTANNFDNRSDNKGPEPEGVTVGHVGERDYAFVGLERTGGVAIFDITEPTRPRFVDYIGNRDFTANPPGPDSGPEVLHFVAANESPTGRPMLLVANEVSGTVTLYGLSKRR
jgi:hypothetical protein